MPYLSLTLGTVQNNKPLCGFWGIMKTRALHFQIDTLLLLFFQ